MDLTPIGAFRDYASAPYNNKKNLCRGQKLEFKTQRR
jgi:hypothetical protein